MQTKYLLKRIKNELTLDYEIRLRNRYPSLLQGFDNHLCYIWYKNRHRIKDAIILASTFGIIFLPVRLFFYTYITPNWLGNLGMLSLIAVIIAILIKKNKLGFLGKIYERRIQWLVYNHKFIILYFIVQAFTIIIFLGTFYLSTYEDTSGDFDFMLAVLQYEIGGITLPLANTIPEDFKVPQLPDSTSFFKEAKKETLIEVAKLREHEITEKMEQIIMTDQTKFLQFVIAGLAGSMNHASQGWSSHFNAVLIIEEIEATFLFFFYRRVYHKVTFGTPWKALALKGFPYIELMEKRK